MSGNADSCKRPRAYPRQSSKLTFGTCPAAQLEAHDAFQAPQSRSAVSEHPQHFAPGFGLSPDAIFSMAINFGAVAGPLLCGFLGERYGWHVGFGMAAVFMLAGLATYLSGYRHLPAKVERKILAVVPMTRRDWKIVAALVAVMGLTVFQSIAYYQLGNVLPIWLQDHGEMNAGGFAIPIPWYQSIDPLFSILCVPVLFGLWRWQQDHGGEPSDLGKIGQGAWLCVCANLVLVVAIAAAGPHKVLWVWPFLIARSRASRSFIIGRLCSRSSRAPRPRRSMRR